VSTPELVAAAAVPRTLPVPSSPPDPAPASAAQLTGLPHRVLPDGAVLVARGRGVAAALLPQLEYRLMRLGIAGQAGLAVLAAAAVVTVTVLIPAQHALRVLNADLVRARQPAAAAAAEQAAPRLVQSLPARGQLPGVIGQVFTQAKAAGVAIDKGRYVYAPAKRGGIERYELEFPVKAPYPQIRSFIDGTLKTVPAVALDKLRLERKAVGEEAVNADVGFVVFVRAERAP
jgi:hypothetical protein